MVRQRAIGKASWNSVKFPILMLADLSLTAIDIRHIEHSDEAEEAVSESLFGTVLPKSRSRLWVWTLDIFRDKLVTNIWNCPHTCSY